MKLSPVGLALIKSFEGCKLTAYQDQRGIWTIGYGHTGPEVVGGLVWTQDQADARLGLDVASRAEPYVNALIHAGYSIPQNEFDALCSLCFNIGAGNFRSSTLVRAFNTGDMATAAAQFLVWDKVNGAPNAGLARRRTAEQALFLYA